MEEKKTAPPRTIAIVQARSSDPEHRGQALQPILERPVLDWVVRRTQRAEHVSEVVVATTRHVHDDPIEFWCDQNQIRFFRTTETSMLDRLVQVAAWLNAEHVVSITTDCPLIDPELVDAVISHFHRDPNCDWCSNFWPERNYPGGLEVECFRLDALRRINDLAETREQRENLNLTIYQQTSAFRISSVCCAEDHSALNWSVQTPGGLELVRTIADWFEHDRFGWREAAELCRRNWHWSRFLDQQQRRAA